MKTTSASLSARYNIPVHRSCHCKTPFVLTCEPLWPSLAERIHLPFVICTPSQLLLEEPMYCTRADDLTLIQQFIDS